LQSLVCAKIVERLIEDNSEANRVVIVRLDSFYNQLNEEDLGKARAGNYNFDHPSNFFLLLFFFRFF